MDRDWQIVATGIYRAAREGLGEGPEKDKGGRQEGPKKGQRRPKESPGDVQGSAKGVAPERSTKAGPRSVPKEAHRKCREGPATA